MRTIFHTLVITLLFSILFTTATQAELEERKLDYSNLNIESTNYSTVIKVHQKLLSKGVNIKPLLVEKLVYNYFLNSYNTLSNNEKIVCDYAYHTSGQGVTNKEYNTCKVYFDIILYNIKEFKRNLGVTY